MQGNNDRKPDSDRRASERWRTERPLRWRLRGDAESSEGVIVERSLNGLVLLSDAKIAPELGEHLKPISNEMAVRHGFRCAVVVRREAEAALGQRKVYLEILA
jgi:hypothetical protein